MSFATLGRAVRKRLPKNPGDTGRRVDGQNGVSGEFHKGRWMASIITTCKGRLKHLKQTLPSMLAQVGVDDVIVVDYGCPDGTFDWCRRYPDPRVKCVGVNAHVAEFNLNRARNIGAKFSTSSELMFVDCDIMLGPMSLQNAFAALRDRDMAMLCVNQADPKGNGDYYFHEPRGDAGYGASAIARMYRREAFERLRGYDEAFRGWGWDDVDLMERARKSGMKEGVAAAAAVFLNHGIEDSVRFYAEKDKAVSAARNRMIVDTKRDVNPGRWGVAGDDMRIHSHDSNWCNPNFIDLTENSDKPGRGDTQSGWHEWVGKTLHHSEILDVGSGLGFSKERMERHGCKVTRYEPAKGLPSDIELPIPEGGEFNGVTAFDVIEHVKQHGSFIRQMTWLSNSWIFLTTPNFNVSRCANWFHAREYTPRQFRTLVSHACEGDPVCFVSDARDGSTVRDLSGDEFDDSDSPTLGIFASV